MRRGASITAGLPRAGARPSPGTLGLRPAHGGPRGSYGMAPPRRGTLSASLGRCCGDGDDGKGRLASFWCWNGIWVRLLGGATFLGGSHRENDSRGLIWQPRVAPTAASASAGKTIHGHAIGRVPLGQFTPKLLFSVSFSVLKRFYFHVKCLILQSWVRQ